MRCVLVVYKKEPPVPPSEAQVLIVEAASHENYVSSLKRLVLNPNFILLMITYGKAKRTPIMAKLSALTKLHVQ